MGYIWIGNKLDTLSLKHFLCRLNWAQSFLCIRAEFVCNPEAWLIYYLPIASFLFVRNFFFDQSTNDFFFPVLSTMLGSWISIDQIGNFKFIIGTYAPSICISIYSVGMEINSFIYKYSTTVWNWKILYRKETPHCFSYRRHKSRDCRERFL